MKWAKTGIAILGVVVVLWSCITAWPAIVHGHPLYAILLALTLLVCGLMLWRFRRPRAAPKGWRLAGTILLAVAAVAWIGVIAWLKPFPAQEPALTSMSSSATVTVDESSTSIVMMPTANVSTTGVFFQPGAKVDARAYAAVLRPIAEAGFPVVIAKQPLGIAFLAMGAFASAQAANPQITDWVVGGHSLGGTVAAMDAEAHDSDASAPVIGLMLYASYPASDMSTTLSARVISLSGTNDGLATPTKIEASRVNLPKDTFFTPIDGAVHAFFGDYGPQPGDGTPTISHDDARQAISRNSLVFLVGVGRTATG
jgi:hypothetical protein